MRRVRPLRRIVGALDLRIAGEITAVRVLLECGHVVPRRKDLAERESVHRRRCKKCQRRERRDIAVGTISPARVE